MGTTMTLMVVQGFASRSPWAMWRVSEQNTEQTNGIMVVVQSTCHQPLGAGGCQLGAGGCQLGAGGCQLGAAGGTGNSGAGGGSKGCGHHLCAIQPTVTLYLYGPALIAHQLLFQANNQSRDGGPVHVP